MWQYWLWFTFIFLINLYFIFLFRILTFRRADIRGRRAVGDKRKGAWPEIFTCFFPFIWSLNILNNSLNILKIVEINGSYSHLTIQIIGFQWGWRYGYGDTNYLQLLTNPIVVGRGVAIRAGSTNGCALEHEVYYSRSWLRQCGNYPNYMDNWIKVPLFQPGLWVTAQGAQVTEQFIKTYGGGEIAVISDPLRLFRTTNALILPARHVIRLLTTAEDVTHSWALPGAGIKLDCVPGRLFVSFINFTREGVYYGQCSELCGWNHYNMPIIVYSIPLEHFLIWWELDLHLTMLSTLPDMQTYGLLNVKYK